MTNQFTLCNDALSNMPKIGEKAPEFVAQSTNGIIHFPDDFSGKWVVFFSHPADFTPVCTSEFIRFQELIAKFQEMNTELVAMSIGAISSHLGWIRAISEMDGGINITFPIIADANMSIARMYGMIHENVSDTSAVRAVFIIDTKGVIRTILYYPPILGRNFTEIMRIIVGLQTADAFKVAIPADWVPGEDVLQYAPQTTADMNKAAKKSTRNAWFMQYQKLKAEDIYDRLTGKSRKRTTK